MIDWADDLSRVYELRERIENSAATSSSTEELIELAQIEEWAVQRAAVDALGIALVDHPNVGRSKLDSLIRMALDERVPSPNRWREGLVAVAGAAPETTHDAALAGFDAIPPEQRGDTGTACVTRMLERIAGNSPAVVVDSLDVFRTISRAVLPKA